MIYVEYDHSIDIIANSLKFSCIDDPAFVKKSLMIEFRFNNNVSLRQIMRKVAFISLISFYLIALVGYSVNIHYCGGELESVSLDEPASVCCCGVSGGMEGCCSDEELLLKLTEDQHLAHDLNVNFENKALDLLCPQDLLADEVEINEDVKVDFYDVKPPPKLPPIWLLNCSFTFYG